MIVALLFLLVIPVSVGAEEVPFDQLLMQSEKTYVNEFREKELVQKEGQRLNIDKPSIESTNKTSDYKIWSEAYVNDANNQLWTVIVLSVLCLSVLLLVITSMQKFHLEKVLFDAIGLTLIIFATVILVIVVQSDQQLTAGAGILGAVAGYLFRGAREQQRESSQ
jgi:hypothetical protein